MSEYKYFEVQQHVDVTVLHLLENKLLNELVVAELSEELKDLVQERKPEKLLINFAGVSRCTSEFIGVMVDLKTFTRAHGGDLRLCGLSDFIREAYRVTNLDGPYFKIHDDVGEALKVF